MFLWIQKTPDGPAKFARGQRVRVIGYGMGRIVRAPYWHGAITNPQHRPGWQYVVRLDTGTQIRFDERDLEPKGGQQS